MSESNSRLARLNLERGQAAFEKGRLGAGMIWTVESMRLAAEAGDVAGRHVALANLTAWRRHHVELKQIFSHELLVTGVAFSPDGKTILTGSDDKTARLWDAASGQPIGKPIQHSSQLSDVAFSPDGKTILTACLDGSARLWDVNTGQLIGQPMKHRNGSLSAAFSPDGKTVLTGCMLGGARLWDSATGRPIGQPVPNLKRRVVRGVQPRRQNHPHRVL